jgi:hypothetical protein
VDSGWSNFFKDVLHLYGIAGVIVIMVLLLALFGKLDNITAQLREAWLHWKERCRKPSPDVNITVARIDAIITQALRSVLSRYHADRAYVFEYSGYDERIRPLPWLYSSCTYEVCNPSRYVTCEKERLQQIPLAAVKYWTMLLGTAGSIYIHDIAEIKEQDVVAYKILTDQQIQSVYCVSLLDFRGLPIGYAGLDYCHGSESCMKCTQDMLDFQYEAVKIAGLLALKRNGTLEQLAGTL